MSSPFDKYHWQITVPSGGWDFDTDAGAAVTIPAADYYIVELCTELESQMDNDWPSREWTVAVSDLGIVTITGDDTWTVNWANTTDALSTALGFAETESVTSNVLTATSQHTHGYYPGLLSHGSSASGGAGRTMDTRWIPEWRTNHVVAGSGDSRIVAPSSPIYQRTISYGLVKYATEIEETSIGTTGWWNSCAAEVCRWYPDRSVGTVVTPGTEGTDYYDVAIMGPVRIRQANHPDWGSFTATLTRQPA